MEVFLGVFIMKKTILFIILLSISFVNAAVSIQQILSEQTFVYVNDEVIVNHMLRNHKQEPITKITLFEEFPSKSKFVDCSNCAFLSASESADKTVFSISIDEISPDSIVNITYKVSLANGNYALNLGHKTYTYMETVQERLGKDYNIEITNANSPFSKRNILINLLLFAIIIFLIFIPRLLKKIKKSTKTR